MRLFLTLVLILLIGVGLAGYFGWLRFVIARQNHGTDVTVRLFPDKAKEDFARFQEKVDQMVTHEVSGELLSVSQGEATLQTSRGTTTFVLTADTKVELGKSPGTLADLRAGAKATVTYSTKDGRYTALSIKMATP